MTATSAAAGSTCPVGTSNAACTATVQVLVPALTVAQTTDVSSTTPGGTVRYTVTVSNTGRPRTSGPRSPSRCPTCWTTRRTTGRDGQRRRGLRQRPDAELDGRPGGRRHGHRHVRREGARAGPGGPQPAERRRLQHPLQHLPGGRRRPLRQHGARPDPGAGPQHVRRRDLHGPGRDRALPWCRSRTPARPPTPGPRSRWGSRASSTTPPTATTRWPARAPRRPRGRHVQLGPHARAGAERHRDELVHRPRPHAGDRRQGADQHGRLRRAGSTCPTDSGPRVPDLGRRARPGADDHRDGERLRGGHRAARSTTRSSSPTRARPTYPAASFQVDLGRC